MILWCY